MSASSTAALGAAPQQSGGRRRSVAGVELVDAAALGEVLGLGRTTILRLARRHRIPFYELGRGWWFDVREVLAALRKGPSVEASNETGVEPTTSVRAPGERRQESE